MDIFVKYLGYLIILIALAVPLGFYINKVMSGKKVFLSKILEPCENFIYKMLHVKKDEEMSWKKYLVSVIMFSIFGLVIVFLLQILQGILPGNPAKIKGTTWDLALNTAISFVTNTNWQAYSGESGLSYLTQTLGLTVQNFVSAGTGIAVLYALIRGFTKIKAKGLGNFWVDLTRSVIYILMPLSIVLSVVLVSQGVTQSVDEYQTVKLAEPIILEDGTKITEQTIPLGPAASQIAIKQLGTNGGGFYGVNSAHPLENPTGLSNLLEVVSILLIPVALCFSFGKGIKDSRQGIAIFVAMGIMLIAALGSIAVSEQIATPQLEQNGIVDISNQDQAGGNMEGKESRFGIVGSSTWAAFTTAASNGSVNSMHDSYTPLGGMVTMILMQLGEVIFGGVGCGLYGMLGFVILAVFMAGLMVGRTPEYLGKKIEPYEMKWAVIVCLATPVAILIGSGIASLIPQVADSLNNSGAHGFSEVLYAYSSAGGNNGSAFAGFGANTPFINVSLGLVMLFVRFIPILGILAIAGSMVQKKKVAVTAGTLSTCSPLFVFLLVFVVLLVGALSFFPALALGPIAEFFGMF
ncbi:MAG: potassium-transporting ATPase subunit KdpA [Thomasclavelia sp.]|uniref:potassium-transporting ATPase subunit KdpA n=1 Tax=Thomasclavelia sp. TaxID=3025757 RepID=UPI0039A1F5E1